MSTTSGPREELQRQNHFISPTSLCTGVSARPPKSRFLEPCEEADLCGTKGWAVVAANGCLSSPTASTGVTSRKNSSES